LNIAEKQVSGTLSSVEEEDIILRTQNDPAAFQPIYEAYFKKIFLFVVHRVGDKDVAADITQQVFFKALTGIHKFQFRGLPFSSWLYRVAINECNETFRKTKRTRFVTLEKGNVENLYEELTADNREEDLERKMPDILQRLLPDELTLIELRFFEKRSFREIAEIINLTEVNAKIKTYRVLQKMKKLFLS
jgi:RNA polymerase sigma-70 factor (ECF subfamily)